MDRTKFMTIEHYDQTVELTALLFSLEPLIWWNTFYLNNIHEKKTTAGGETQAKEKPHFIVTCHLRGFAFTAEYKIFNKSKKIYFTNKFAEVE